MAATRAAAGLRNSSRVPLFYSAGSSEPYGAMGNAKLCALLRSACAQAWHRLGVLRTLAASNRPGAGAVPEVCEQAQAMHLSLDMHCQT